MNIWLQSFIISIGAGIVVAVLMGLWNKGWPMFTDAQKVRAQRNNDWMNREIMLAIRYPVVSNFHVLRMLVNFLFSLLFLAFLLSLFFVPPLAPDTSWYIQALQALNISPLVTLFSEAYPTLYTMYVLPYGALIIIAICVFGFGKSSYDIGKHTIILRDSRIAILNMTRADQMLQSRRLEMEAQARKNNDE